MRFHDFHLSGYKVSDFGGAIIVDVAEVPLPQLIHQLGDQLAEWWRLHGGYAHWSDDRAEYIETLERAGYHSWTIDSAIGFEGFVIAKTVEQIEDENHPKT